MSVSFVELFKSKQELVITIPVCDLITESVDELEQALIKLGARIIPDTFSIKKEMKGSKLDMFIEEHIEKYKNIIVIGDEYLILEKVGGIVKPTEEGQTHVFLLLSGGGTAKIEMQYFNLLQKIWFKGRRLTISVDLATAKDSDIAEINTELSRIENFDTLAEKCMQIREIKNNYVKDHKFEEATAERLKEKELLKELHELADHILKAFCEKIAMRQINTESESTNN